MKADMQKLITGHLENIERWWVFRDSSSDSIKLSSMAEGLIDSIEPNGSIPSDIKGDNYRATTVATVLEALSDVDLLPNEAKHTLQDYLIWHQDKYTASKDYYPGDDKDCAGWAKDEGVSVWATSQAITALLKSGYLSRPSDEIKTEKNGDGKEKISKAVKWLIEQQQLKGGWGFQNFNKYSCCKENVPITALAIISLSWAYLYKNKLELSKDDIANLERAIANGKGFLISPDQLKSNGGVYYWVYNNGHFSLTSSVWALEALKMAITDKNQYNDLFEKKLKFVMDKILYELQDSTKKNEWQSEKFFQGGTTKYKDRGPLYLFTPYLLSILLHKDYKDYINPLDERILSIITWLVKNRGNGWELKDIPFNTKEKCTYVAAMALNVITKWLKCIMEVTFNPIVSTIFLNDNADKKCCEKCGVGFSKSEIQSVESQEIADFSEPEIQDVKPQEKLKWIIWGSTGCLILVGFILLFFSNQISEFIYQHKSGLLIALIVTLFVSLFGYFGKGIFEVIIKGGKDK